jgi:hypothetical protein
MKLAIVHEVVEDGVFTINASVIVDALWLQLKRA